MLLRLRQRHNQEAERIHYIKRPASKSNSPRLPVYVNINDPWICILLHILELFLLHFSFRWDDSVRGDTVVSALTSDCIRIHWLQKNSLLGTHSTEKTIIYYFLCLLAKWLKNSFFCSSSFSFHLECCLLVLPLLKDRQGFSSAWRHASMRRLILQTKLNGFPLEGLWLIPDAYSILCGHCSRKFPPRRQNKKGQQKWNMLVWDGVQRGLCLDLWVTHVPVMKANAEEVWHRCMEETQENKTGHPLAGQRPVLQLNEGAVQLNSISLHKHLRTVSLCYVPQLYICVLSTMSGLGPDLHWVISRR